MFKHLIIVCFITSFIYSAPISLEEAISVALVNNIDIKTSTTAIEKSIEQRREAWSYVMPKLNTSVNYSRTESFQTKQFSELFSGAGFGDVTQESYTYNLKLTQPLFSGEARPYIKASALDILIQKNSQDRTEQTVMYTVLAGYLSALSAYDQVLLAEESLSVLKSEHKTITAKFNEGLLNKTSYLQSKLAIESESLTLLQAKKEYRVALANLKTVLNLDSDTSISVVDIDIHNNDTPTFDVSKKTDDAYSNRSDIENAAFQIRILELVALSQYRQKWPSINLFGQYGYGNSSRFSMDDASKDWVVGATGTIKLFTGFEYSSKQEQYQLDITNAMYQYTALEHRIATEVEETIYNFSIADQQKKLAQRQYDLSIEIFDMQQASFDNGLISYDDYLEALLDVKRSKTAVIKSNYGWLESLSRVYLSTGELNWDSISVFLGDSAFR